MSGAGTFFPSGLTLVQPAPGVVVLGDNGVGPCDVDMSQVMTFENYVSFNTLLMTAFLQGLPTSDPGILNALYWNGAFLCKSS